jgi:ribonuclease VapC
MIIDSSAILAILFREPTWPRLLDRIIENGAPGVGAATLVESALVLTARLGPTGTSLLARFVQESGVREIPFTEAHRPVAVDAFLRYGRGRHPAALNYGDCLTYATATLAREPLLCVGDDFPQTDLPLVLL